MSRAIRITAIVALVLEAAYVIIGRFAGPLLVYFSGFLGSSYIGSGMSAGLSLYIVEIFVTSMVRLVFFLVFCILLISTSKTRNEKTGLEITGLVIIGGVFPLLSLIINIIVTYVIGRSYSVSFYGIRSSLNAVSSMFGVVSSAATIMFVVSSTISICRKKFMIPVEYANGIGVNDEFSSVEMGGYY